MERRPVQTMVTDPESSPKRTTRLGSSSDGLIRIPSTCPTIVTGTRTVNLPINVVPIDIDDESSGAGAGSCRRRRMPMGDLNACFRTDEDATHVGFCFRERQHHHLVASENDGVASGHDDVAVAQDGHDR